MTTKYFGQPIKRKEDPRLLTGQALFIDDVELPGMLHAAFLRSDYAHARVLSIDTSAARERPGVVMVITAEDMGDDWAPGPLAVPPPFAIEGSVFHERTQIPIVKDKIRQSGEVVACVIAESRYIAEDAVGDIFVEVEPLGVVTDLEKALEEDAPLLYEELGTNLAADVKQEVGSYAQAAEEADVIIKRRFEVDRCVGGSIETRGMVVSWDPKTQQLTVWATTQAPIPMRNVMAARLGLPESQVRVITPFIGGGFGPKIMISQPDEVLITWATMKLGRPIKWIEDRQESFFSSTSERDQVHYAEMALTKEGKILGVKDVFYHNTGAYDPYGMTVPLNTQTHTLGNYDVPNFYTQILMVFTNEMIVTPVRGAGRPQGTYVMERLIDVAAKELGIDPVELRRRNLVQPDQFPYETGIIGQDFVKNVLDSGDYEAALDKAIEMIGYKQFLEEEQPRLRAEGKHVGIGVVCFTEGTAVGPYEGARITVGGNGKVTVVTGVSTQGQGHYTSFAQVIADQLGVGLDDVTVITGDTGRFHWGAGLFASRGAAIVGNAIHAAAVKVREKILETASKALEAPVEELELEDGEVRVADVPRMKLSLGELAVMANPTRGTIPPGVEPGLEAVSYFAPPHGATGAGAVAMIVEVDAETMGVEIKRFVIVHDCGVVINPMIVEGQIHGGVSMGIGTSFYEKMVYDENGQLLNASLMDYLLPRSTDMPLRMEIAHLVTPTPLNELGIKGVGEAGAIPTPAAFAQAVENALAPYGIEVVETPLSPNLLYEYVEAAKKK
ncbi:MAG: molybdopterin cofactor-binding domain-containing protein [Anaerolineae bacterium]